MDQGSRFFFTYKVDVDLYESLIKVLLYPNFVFKIKELKESGDSMTERQERTVTT
jgi:hypothetical protein